MIYIALTLPELFSADTRDLYLDAQNGDRMLYALDANLYTAAASVDTDDLDVLFQMTNTIDAPWFENPAVIAHGDVKRSMSVGDIAVDLETEKVFRCAAFGWEEVTDETLHACLLVKAMIGDAFARSQPLAKAS